MYAFVLFMSVSNSLSFSPHKSVVDTTIDEFYDIMRKGRKPKDDKRKH